MRDLRTYPNAPSAKPAFRPDFDEERRFELEATASLRPFTFYL